MTPNTLSRRNVLRILGATASTIGLPLLLEGCAGYGSAPTSPTAAAASTAQAGLVASTAAPANASSGGGQKWGGVTLPTYVPFQGLPKPDYPASDDGIVPAGYLTYPKNLVKTSAGTFGKGDDVSLFTYQPTQPPTPVGQNPAWQAINKAMGVNLTCDNVPLQDYIPKLNTLLAGGKLTDIISMNLQGAFIPNELQFFERSCADLTPYLSGDAIKAYPNLANLPAHTWKMTVFNGKIYEVPRVVNAVGANLLAAQHLLDGAGIKKDFKNTDDFTAALKALTTAGTWGIGGLQAFNPGLTWLLGVFGAPNNWRVDSSGTFTKDWETAAYKEAVVYARSLWDQKLVDPNTPTFVQQTGAYKFYAGEMAMYPSEFAFWGINWDQTLQFNKDFKLSTMPEFPAAPNVKPVHFQSSGVLNIAVLQNASPERIREVLQVLDFLAAPFGSEENLLLTSGVKDVDFTVDANGNPVLNQQGQSDAQWAHGISP
jgi:putative aldouronate transport system substrate-binding protein